MNSTSLSYKIWDGLKNTTELDTDMIGINIQYTQFYEHFTITEEDVQKSYRLPRHLFSPKKDEKSRQNLMGYILNTVSPELRDSVDSVCPQLAKYASDMVDNPININVRGLVLYLDIVHVHRFDRDDQVLKLAGINVEEDNVEDLCSMSTECRICLDTLSIGERVIRLPCNHVFHADCLITWLQKTQFCPLCRCSLL